MYAQRGLTFDSNILKWLFIKVCKDKKKYGISLINALFSGVLGVFFLLFILY